MGKFNSTDGVNFLRSINEVVQSYARYLLDKKVITDDEFYFYINDGRDELLNVLLDKIHEREVYKGVKISTLDAFYHFCEFILHEYNGQKIWNTFVRDMFVAVEHNKNIAIMASRSIGKSFFLYILYPLFKMFCHAKTKILAVSNIPLQCVENLRILKELIDTNEIVYQLKEIYLGKELKWTERQIQYNGGMFITLSAGTSPRGLHVHYTIVDDMITEGCQLNDEEAVNYVFSQLYPTVQRNKGRMIISGTPQHKEDLYHYVMGEKQDFEGDIITDGRLSWKGFFSKTFPLANRETEKSNYPDIYTDAEIFGTGGIKETQGDMKFEREYMLNCIDESMIIFSPHLVDSVSDGQEPYKYSPDSEVEQFIIAADVATSGAASADYSAFVVLELVPTDKGKKKIIRYIIHEQGMDIATQIDTLEKLSDTFNNAVVVVEKNNVGVALIQELQKRNVNVEEFITTKDKKEGMIRYLVNEMKNKNFWFCENVNEITRLKKELLNFGVKRSRSGKERMEALTGHDDMVIALAIANQAAQDMGGLPYAVTINTR